MKNLIACGLILMSTPHLITKPFATQTISTIIDTSLPYLDTSKIKSIKDLPHIGTTAEEFYANLIEGESIIIVTSTVLHFLMQYLKIDNNPFDMTPRPKIDPSKWITLQVTDAIYVMVPHKYLTSRPNYNALQQMDLSSKGSPYSAEELAIGIKLKGQRISDKKFFAPSTYKAADQYPSEYPMVWVSHHFIAHLNDIFIPLTTYKDLRIIEHAPTSVIIATGHGSSYTTIDEEIRELRAQPHSKKNRDALDRLYKFKKQGFIALSGGQVAGLGSHDFSSFVGYTIKNLRLALLFFNTCFGSTVNIYAALQVLADQEKQELKNLTIPYIIISGAIANAPSWTKLKKNYDTPGKSSLDRPVVKRFFDTLNQSPKISDAVFVDALTHIYPFFGSVSSANNIPIIKYPHDVWRPLHMSDRVVLINPQFIEKYHNQKSVNVSQLFTKQKEYYPRVLLFEVATVPFELVISGKDISDLPSFISYLPGNAIHRLTKVSSAGYKLADVLQHFFSIKKLYSEKVFLIDELVVLNTISKLDPELNKPITLRHVVIIHKMPDDEHPRPWYLINFLYNNKSWSADIAFEEFEPSLQEDSSGTVEHNWETLVGLSKNYAAHIQALQKTGK